MPNPTENHASKSPKATILVIDSSPLSLIATAGVFDTQGYSCICARSLDQGLSAMSMGPIDLVVCDVGNDAPAALETLVGIRATDANADLPAIMIADTKWSGLEKKTEALSAVTRCLFKPIDPGSLLAVTQQLLLLPQIVASHRRRGTRPGRPGWVSL